MINEQYKKGAGMTNEKAKKILFMEWQDFLEHNIDYGGVSEAYKKAFEALDQQSNSDEDCISRSQALSDYADWYGYGYRDNTFYKHLKDMPSIQPKTECSCEQIKWERDTAIAQLKELGYGLGEKSKTDVLDKIRAEIEQDAIKSVFGTKYIFVNRVNQIIDKYKVEKE